MGLLSAIFFLFNKDTDYYFPKWSFLTVCGILAFGVGIAMNYSVPAGVLFSYTLISAYLFGTYYSVTHEKRVNYQSGFESLLTIIFGLTAVSVATFIPMWIIEDFAKWIPVLLVINMYFTFKPFLMYCERKNTHINVYGFGANPSTCSSFTSILAAFSLMLPPWHEWLIPFNLAVAIVTVIRTRAASGAGGLAAAIAVYYYQYWYIVAPLYAVIFAYVWFKHHNFVSLSHRDVIVKFVHHYVYPLVKNKWFGLGVGSFSYIMPARQIYIREINKNKPNIPSAIPKEPRLLVLWAHCDLYQWYIEAGIIGALLGLVFVGELVYLAPIGALAFLACFFSNALTNFVFHLAPDLLLFLIACRIIYT